MRQVDRHDQGDHLVEVADLIAHDIFRPETGVNNIRRLRRRIVRRQLREVADVLREIAWLDVVDGFGVGNMID